jgi:hypothetical protein
MIRHLQKLSHSISFLLLLFFCCKFSAFKRNGIKRCVSNPAIIKGNRQSLSPLADAASDAAASAATSAAYDFIQSQGEWYAMGECSVLLPSERNPKSIIHFVGGFVAGSAVTVTYGRMLTALANNGHLIIATPIPAVDLNHARVAADVATSFTKCYNANVKPLLGAFGKDVPIFGLSHSLGKQ